MRRDYQAARERAATFSRGARGCLVVKGRDRASYLQGLLTNDVVGLKAGEGCYAAYLTPQGRMITDLSVYELGDVMLLSLGLEQKDEVLAKLDQFIFSEDVQLGDLTSTFTARVLVGPDSARCLSAAIPVGRDVLESLAEYASLRTTFEGSPAIVLRSSDAGEPGFEVLVEAPADDRFRERLMQLGAIAIAPEAAEVLRVEAGIPRFNRDMTADTIPLEAGIESRAISLNKGCYVGQEVIIRVLHRGHGRVARKLVGMVLEGVSAVVPGTPVQVDGQVVGEATSSIISPALGKPVAMGYVKREFLAPGTQVVVDGRMATVTALPFVGSGGT